LKLISACLCGINCKYNGRNNCHPVFESMLDRNDVFPVCPEQMGGLPTPRPPCEISGGTGMDVLEGRARVVSNNNLDLTAAFIKGAQKLLQLALDIKAEEAIFQSRSPSCGCGQIYDGTFSSQLIEGDGVAAALLKQNGVKVINDADFLQGR